VLILQNGHSSHADNDIEKHGVISFNHQTIEQNQTITINYSLKANSSTEPDKPLLFYGGVARVEVTTPSGITYFQRTGGTSIQITYPKGFEPALINARLIYPNAFASTSEIGNYTVYVRASGFTFPTNTIVSDERETFFTVIPKSPPSASSFLITPALYIAVLGVAGLVIYGLVVRVGLVKGNPIFSKLRQSMSRFSFLDRVWIWMPVSVLVIILCAVFFPLKTLPVLALSLAIIGIWGGQTLLDWFFRRRLYVHFERGSALYTFGWMSVALHEVSHAIVNMIFGAKIRDIHIGTHGGHVDPAYRNFGFRTWCGIVFGPLAPAYFFPAILLLLWFVSVGIKLDLPYRPMIEDMYTPFNRFVSLGFVNFFYWIVTNFANPLMYLFMYFFVTSSIAAGPSEPFREKGQWAGDWAVALRAIKLMPKHTLTFVLGFLSVVSVIGLLNYDIVIGFFGFWLLLFLLIFFSQVIALVFARLTLGQGIALIVAAIIANVLAGYIVTEWTSMINQLQCSVNPYYC